MSQTYGIYPNFRAQPFPYPGYYVYPVRVSSVDTDVEEMIAAGIHVCIAAGNNSFKADVYGGADYDNNFNSSGTKYYHRGSSPYSDNAFMVGCIDPSTHSGGLEQKSSFSTTGPGITIWAPGQNIMSSVSSNNDFGVGTGTYPSNNSYRIANISGTSMASPQVCGLGATILQLNPHLTPAQLQQKMTNLATIDPLRDGGSTGTNYNDNRSLLNAPNKLLYTPFNSGIVLSAS